MKLSNTTGLAQTLFKLAVSLIVTCSFSCAPKKSGVRATVKTGQTSLSAATSVPAEQQAAAQSSLYKISSISLPNATDAGVTIDSELLNPSNQYLPLTTRHENGILDSQGIFNDSARGLQVHVNSRCTDTGCTKYLLLVTVVRNNQAVFQSGAISFKEDCNFYSISVSTSSGQMFQSLNDFDSKYSNVSPIGDSTSCLQ